MRALLLLLAVIGCNYTPMRMVDGKPLYLIDCEGTFEPCRKRASKLCPGGYETIDSSKETRDDRKQRARAQVPPIYRLQIACRD